MEAWIRKVTEGQPIKPNDKTALRDYADDLVNCQETLTAMGKLSEIDTQRSLSIIFERLPPYAQNSWRKEATDSRKRYGFYPGIQRLVKFVTRIADQANDPVFGTFSSTVKADNYKPPSQGYPPRSRPQGKGSGGAAFTTVAATEHPDDDYRPPSRPCPMCRAQSVQV